MKLTAFLDDWGEITTVECCQKAIQRLRSRLLCVGAENIRFGTVRGAVKVGMGRDDATAGYPNRVWKMVQQCIGYFWAADDSLFLQESYFQPVSGQVNREGWNNIVDVSVRG